MAQTAMLNLVSLTKLRTAQRAVAKHTQDLLALEKPLRQLGYRLVPLAAAPVVRRRDGATPRRHQLRCPDCTRTFALPHHLGRHRHAMHHAKK